MEWMEELLDLRRTRAAALFAQVRYPWEILGGLEAFLRELRLPEEEFEQIAEGVWAARDAQIAPTACLEGPCVIGHGTEVAPFALVRRALAGDGCVIGHGVEAQNSVLFDGAVLTHHNYVSDSVLGHQAHLGAGAVISNEKSDRTQVSVRALGETIPTGLRRLGAVVGDFAEIGCNCALNPGSVVGRRTIVYPGSIVRGYLPGGQIFKAPSDIVEREERNGG